MLGVTTKPTPLFNTPHIKEVFTPPINLDSRFLVNELETILYPNVTVTYKKIGNSYQITTDDYPSKIPLYTHPHFLDTTGETKPVKRERPTAKQMLTTLLNMPKLPYIWGGTFPEGVADLFKLFPQESNLTAWEWSLFHLRGIDCSGILYYASNGTLPRNTGPLWNVCNQISSPQKPLDLIFFPGHVIIYLGDGNVMESRQYNGTNIMPLANRIDEIEKNEEGWIKFGRFL